VRSPGRSPPPPRRRRTSSATRRLWQNQLYEVLLCRNGFVSGDCCAHVSSVGAGLSFSNAKVQRRKGAQRADFLISTRCPSTDAGPRADNGGGTKVRRMAPSRHPPSRPGAVRPTIHPPSAHTTRYHVSLPSTKHQMEHRALARQPTCRHGHPVCRICLAGPGRDRFGTQLRRRALQTPLAVHPCPLCASLRLCAFALEQSGGMWDDLLNLGGDHLQSSHAPETAYSGNPRCSPSWIARPIISPLLRPLYQRSHRLATFSKTANGL